MKSDTPMFGTIDRMGVWEVQHWTGSAWRLLTKGSWEICTTYLADCRKNNAHDPRIDPTDFQIRRAR